MSIRAIRWAWDQPLPPTRKMVLLALANFHHTTTGACYPSLASIVTMTGLSERAVRYALRDLEAAKIIGSTRRKVGGQWTSSAYTLFGKGSVMGQDVPRSWGKKQPLVMGQDVPHGDGAPDAPNRVSYTTDRGRDDESVVVPFPAKMNSRGGRNA